MEAVGSFLEEGADKECVEVTGGGRHTTSTNTTGGEAAVTPPAQHGKKRTRTDEPMDCASDRCVYAHSVFYRNGNVPAP